MPAPYKAEGYPERECAHCGKVFRPSWPQLAYCTPLCRESQRKLRDRARKHAANPDKPPPEWPIIAGEADLAGGFAAHNIADPERGIYLKLQPEPNRTLGGVAG